MIKRTLLLFTLSILLVISASVQSEAATPLRLKIISNIGHNREIGVGARL